MQGQTIRIKKKRICIKTLDKPFALWYNTYMNKTYKITYMCPIHKCEMRALQCSQAKKDHAEKTGFYRYNSFYPECKVVKIEDEDFTMTPEDVTMGGQYGCD